MNDFKLDETGDLLIVNGDFVISDATIQHQEHIIISQKGEYKQYPEVGVGIANVINDENPESILTQVRRNFEYDGMTINKLEFNLKGSIEIDAPYN